MSRDNNLILRSSDNQLFNVDKKVVQQSKFLKDFAELYGTDNPNSVFDVHSKILAIVIDYCEHHVDSQVGELVVPEDEHKKWDADFIGDFDYPALIRLATASTFLQIPSLFDLSAQAIANMLVGKTAQQMRELCNMKNDITAEEEKKFRREHNWLLPNVDEGRRTDVSSTPSSSGFR